MALPTLTGTSHKLPSSGHRPSISLAPHVVRLSQLRLRRLSLPTTTRISLQLRSSRHHPSIPQAQHLLCSRHLSQCRPCPLSSSALAASVFSSPSAAPPLTSRRSQNIQPLDEQLETDGAGRDGGPPRGGAGAVEDEDGDNNRRRTLMVPPRDDWSPAASETEDNAAIVPGSVVWISSELEKFPLLRMLEGLMERLSADGVFLAKVAVEYGLAIFTKAVDLMADFMIVHLLPLPTAFQIALPGSSYSLAQRLGALAVRTAVRNALIDERNVTGKSSPGEVENVQILSVGLAYGVYMAVAGSLRSQVLNGIIKQRYLEPLLHQHKFMLSAISFAFQTGNTFFGSLLWIHYARLVGIKWRSRSEIFL